MVGTAQRSKPSTPSRSTPPLKRLISISILMGSIGVAGGLLLRLLSPAAVSGFSGLGRAQNFPEVDWPGQIDMDELPDDVPQPEYSDDYGWEDGAGEEPLPEVILDSELENETLYTPSDSPPSDYYVDEPRRSPYSSPAEDYSEALRPSEDEDYGESDYPAEETEASDSDPYWDRPEDSDEAYEAESYPTEYADEPYAAEASPEPPAEGESWDADPWVEAEPWAEPYSDPEASHSDWQETEPITADDFPAPDLPPAYEAPVPQSAVPLAEDGSIL